MKFITKLDAFVIGAKNRFNTFLNDESGDTNFISMLVLLGIALALAGVFLGFKDQILNWVNTNIGSFFSTSAGATTP